jgi:hypothetical protein
VYVGSIPACASSIDAAINASFEVPHFRKVPQQPAPARAFLRLESEDVALTAALGGLRPAA